MTSFHNLNGSGRIKQKKCGVITIKIKTTFFNKHINGIELKCEIKGFCQKKI